MPSTKRKIIKYSFLSLALLIVIFFIWQGFKKPPTNADWQEQLAVSSTAEFNGDKVTVHNVRNFRYYPTEQDMHPAYYDKTYDLTQIKKVWFIAEPFNEEKYAAHTLLSFEFNNGDFLSISIEARKTKSQVYSAWKGLLRTYPLMYIAADERDVVLLRTNVRQDKVFAYPVNTSQENARILLTDMLNRMNDLVAHPIWYNTIWSNCTSEIAYHVNKITPGKIPKFSWQLVLTASADELALKHGLLDTNLPIEQARQKYYVTQKSLQIGDVADYSKLIRQ